jgi:hypothetical protein
MSVEKSKKRRREARKVTMLRESYMSALQLNIPRRLDWQKKTWVNSMKLL